MQCANTCKGYSCYYIDAAVLVVPEVNESMTHNIYECLLEVLLTY
jgi:hypothetical protein